ncbi:hypothetical protein PR202_ga06976 [Eleusine coracana subsp. coracana]|uniref:UDP-glucose 4,6-dehydratase n=1 Tax=Eleusine coracana subsp. coracana TaxID=191504 RepID=A0AAV5BW96_ELECO|nr:hypothetical protein PR202_ga06976 [Eleusine coracana subsp. coracana]
MATQYKPKNILITGAAGFIASHVAIRIVQKYPDYKIVVLDKLDYCSNLKNLLPVSSLPNFKFVKGDIASADLVNFLLVTENIDTIMHFAAQTHVDNSFGNSFEFTKNNIYGTHVLLEACKVTGQIRRFIHVSTDERYFLDDEKLKSLGWAERTPWEEGLRKTMEWYVANSDYWGDVSGALLPHPRTLMMPGYEGSEEIKGILSQFNSSPTNIVDATSEGAPEVHAFKFLIYGRTGWIGGLLGKICEKQGIPYAYGKGRLENRSSLILDIQTVKPTHVFNAAGVTGRPNVDWCESHKPDTIRANVVGTLTLADVCREHGLLMLNYATGCIFEYDAQHPEGSGVGFKEEDKPNFTGSFYSKTKAMVEELLKEYDNVCTLRVRMPITSDLTNPRNFITKISRYNKVVNIPNSMTVLDELLPISVEMAKRNLRGIWNFTNPGVVSHNEILEMYKQYIDPSFKWTNFTLEEQAKVIVAPRSNNEMDATKLKNEFPELLSIKDSLIKYVFEPNRKVSAN